MQTWTLGNGIKLTTDGLNGTRKLYEDGIEVDAWRKGEADTAMRKLAEGFIRK